MLQTQSVIKNPLTFRELKEFAAIGGPAVTVYMPTDIPGGPNRRLGARIRKLAEDLEVRCTERAIEKEECRAFLAPFREQAEAIEGEAQGAGLVLLRSMETFHYYWLPRSFDEQIVVADNFHIRPMLDLLDGERRFYVLALAQKDLRLLRFTNHTSEEVDLGDPGLHNMVKFLQTDQPDHSQRGGTGVAASNATFTTANDKEAKDEWIRQFFLGVNKAIVERLRDSKTPMVLAGVDYEVAIYRKVNTYPHLCGAAVSGAANGLRGPELHTKSLECLEECRKVRLEQILAQHDKQGGGVADAKVTEIVKAAYEGRVSHLLISDDAKVFGSFDEATHRVREHKRPATRDEDLLNAAAIQTVLHGGDVAVLPAEKIPGSRPLAAVMRY